MKIPRRFVAEGRPAFTLCAPQRRPGGLPLRTPNHFHPALCRKGMTVCVRESTGLASRGCYPENTAQVCSGRPPGLHFVRTTKKARRSSATHTEPFSSCVVPKRHDGLRTGIYWLSVTGMLPCTYRARL